jgi:hypothetical protein
MEALIWSWQFFTVIKERVGLEKYVLLMTEGE